MNKKNKDNIKMEKINISEIKMTQYSHGAGCGCKLSPKALTTILKTKIDQVKTNNLIVGNW